jgi:hypothetical protein
MAFEKKDENAGEQAGQGTDSAQSQQSYQQADTPPVQHNTYVTAVATAVATTEQKGNGLGVTALVLSIIAIIGSWIPFLNIFSLLFAVVAVCLGIAGLIVGIVKKRSKGLAIAGLVIGVISIIIFAAANVAAINAIDDAYAPINTGGSSGTEQSGGTPAVEAEEPAVEETLVPLGPAVNTAKFEILVNGSSSTTQINASQFLSYEPDAGNEYVIINVSLKNISNEMESFNCSDFQLITLDGSIQYSPSSLVVTSGDETFFWFDSLNPGTAKTGNVVFELPQGIDLSTLKLRYNDTWSFDTNHYFFAIQ